MVGVLTTSGVEQDNCPVCVGYNPDCIILS